MLSFKHNIPIWKTWEANLTTAVVDWSACVSLYWRYGEIESIRVLHERFCAFVNFRDASMAARAMEKLNVSAFLLFLLCQHYYFHSTSYCRGVRCAYVLAVTGSLYWKHSFSGALSWPPHSEVPSYSTQDLPPCHTAGRHSCWVRSQLAALLKTLVKKNNNDNNNHTTGLQFYN